MRFLHTSDWHLGRLFHGIHLTNDQSYVMDQIIAVTREMRPDIVVVSGDVYDRTVPPTEAVALLDDVLCRLVLGLGVRTVVIAGNHDSPDRLAFGSRVLAERGLHVSGVPDSRTEPLLVEDRHGVVAVHAMPYAEPPVLRAHLGRDDLHTHDEAMRAYLAEVRGTLDRSTRSILVAHAFAAGGEGCESERALSVGGAGTVDVRAFGEFAFVALGHLHRAQAPLKGRIEYSGSPLKYSFSEVAHEKSVSLVEVDACGSCTVERVPLRPRHDVRKIEGTLQELLSGGSGGGSGNGREDYILAVLTDRGPLLEPMRRLQEIYPNLLAIERPEVAFQGDRQGDCGDHRKSTDLELFRAFTSAVTGEELTSIEERAYVEAVEALRRAEREASR